MNRTSTFHPTASPQARPSGEAKLGALAKAAATTFTLLGTLAATPAAAGTISSLTDDFENDTIDSAKWNIVAADFETGTGDYTADTTTSDGQLTIAGTTTSTSPPDFWGGAMLESVDTFSSSLEATIQVDRISLTGTGTGQRSALMLVHPDGEHLLFARNTEGAVAAWTYNYSQILAGGANAGVDGAGIDGVHTMKLVFTPLGGSNAQVQMFLDDTPGATQALANWDNSKDFKVRVGGMARATGDTATAVFDNFSATTPSTAPFAITEISYQGGGSPSAVLTFNSVDGRNYAVDFSTTLLPNGLAGGWQELTDSLTGTGDSTQFEDTLAAGQGFPNLFYRVRDPALQPVP